MAKRTPHPDPITERILSAIWDENNKQIRSYKDAAAFLGMNYNTLASRVRKANMSTIMVVDYDAFMPFPIAREHREDKEYSALRGLAELQAEAVNVSDKRVELVDLFRRKSKVMMCCYDDEYGFYWRKRASGEKGWLVRD